MAFGVDEMVDEVFSQPIPYNDHTFNKRNQEEIQGEKYCCKSFPCCTLFPARFIFA